jgi:spoIIIJ-associated protein
VGKQEFKMRFTFGEKPQQTEEKEEEVFQEKRAERPARSERSDYSERSSSRRRDSSERPQRRRQPEEPIPERPKEPLSDEVRNHPSYNEIFELIREIATNLGIDDLELEDYQRDGAWVIEASGENVSQLIGKRGKNLDSVQYLMNIILNRGNEERIKLVLDAQGYREKRYRNLMSLANRMYKKALSSRRSVELEPMSTLDRRTVHMALKDKDGIETFSRGAEPMRRVVISPLKKSRPENNTGWQPIASEEDEIESIERNETSSAVPMFMEEDV